MKPSSHQSKDYSPRHYSAFDHLVMGLDVGIRTLLGQPKITERPNPAKDKTEADLNEADRELAGRLMRINHAGEVAAQGLYQGQALTARLPEVRDKMERAALEENDHLDWCETRAKELGTHVSYLNPVWYAGSVAIGALAGIAGDRWSLGFVAETEHQVVRHLDEHLQRIPESDVRSRAILEQMKTDEGHHATVALEAGGAELPYPVKKLMGLTSKIMTRTAFWL
ncbi:2-polyprenyl-3-methyl-6-methoxy-1,4-benzoquinone monooxygenase [Kaarinaea lacus]